MSEDQNPPEGSEVHADAAPAQALGSEAVEPAQEPDAPPRIIWHNRPYDVELTKYADEWGNTCVVLLDPESGQVEAKVSVNLRPLPPHQFYLKDYSENRGIAAPLLGAKLIRKLGMCIPNGSMEFCVYEILPRLGARHGIEIPSAEAAQAPRFNASQAIPGEVPDGGVPAFTKSTPSDEDVGEAPSSMAAFEAQQNAGLVEKARQDAARRADEELTGEAGDPDPAA